MTGGRKMLEFGWSKMEAFCQVWRGMLVPWRVLLSVVLYKFLRYSSMSNVVVAPGRGIIDAEY